MQIVVCPDKFAGTLSASQAGSAIAEGWRKYAPAAEISVIPISDGGYGFLDSISTALNLKTEPIFIRGPLKDVVPAEFAFDSKTAYIEVAQVVGIHLLTPNSDSVMSASSYGVGELISAAVEKGFKRIVIGLGGTATSDGGAGALAALGAIAFDSSGNEIQALKNGVADLLSIARMDLTAVEKFLTGVTIEILTDVDNPLLGVRGTAIIFAPQKGATQLQVKEIELSLMHFSQLVGKREDGKNPAVALGAGAAGGLGFALMRIGATRSEGIERVIQILGLKDAISKADLVITGEGKFDWQSLDGKAVTGVAKTALNLGKAVIVLAGQVEIGRRDWQTIGLSGAFSMEEFRGLDQALAQPIETLAQLSERVARTWNR